MLVLGRKAPDLDQARRMAEAALTDGQAWEKFRTLVQAQGGDVSFIDHPDSLPTAAVIRDGAGPAFRLAERDQCPDGWRNLGHPGRWSRERKGDPIDHGVGIVIHHKVGDQVEQGQPLFTVYAKTQKDFDVARERLLEAHCWSSQPSTALPLFYDVIS